MPENGSFLDTLSDVGRYAGYAMNPFGAVVDAVTSERAVTKRNNTLEREDMSIYSGFSEGQSSLSGMTAQGRSNSGSSFFGGLGDTIRGFATDFTDFVGDVRPAADILGINIGGSNTAPQAAKTITRSGAEETAMSGEITGANVAMLPSFVQGAGRVLSNRGVQGFLGGGGLVAGAGLMDSQSGKPRITRRMKSDVRKIYMMAGMDPNMTAQILNNLGTYPRFNFNASLVFLILTKRFRNDGPVVTKAAVRKTRSTLRRMKGVVDMYNSVCKPATRRAPARRAAPKAVQLIKN